MQASSPVGWIAALLFACATTLPVAAACADTLYFSFQDHERLARAMSPTDGSKPIVYTEDRAPLYVLTRIVVEGTSADQWNEAFEVLNTMRRDEPKKVAAWYERFRQQGDAHCKSEWAVLDQTATSLTFERKSGDCPPFGPQQALYRVMYGRQQVFTLIATRKGTMDEATRDAWLAALRTASVEN